MGAESTGKKCKGRPKRKEPLKMVYFSESTFGVWNQLKKEFSSEEHTMSSDEYDTVKIMGMFALCLVDI